MQRFKALFRKTELHAFIACLVLLIFSWPILTIIEPMRNGFVFFYLFAAWGLVIILLLMIAISYRGSGSERSAKSDPEA